MLTGAAIGLLDAIFLPLHISGITTRFVGYGLPRVGNQEFANYVDSLPLLVTHINNKEDIVPILPGRFLGYHHPSGEIHIVDSGSWLSCPGEFEYLTSSFTVLNYRVRPIKQARITQATSALSVMYRTYSMAIAATTTARTMVSKWAVDDIASTTTPTCSWADLVSALLYYQGHSTCDCLHSAIQLS